jgi:hypothetical protein
MENFIKGMKSLNKHTSFGEYYFSILQNINVDTKLDLISQLSQSLKSDKVNTASLESLFGAYESEENSDEIISEIRSSRISTRGIELL